MSIWHTLLYWIGLRPTPGPRKYVVPDTLSVSITTLAQHEGRPLDELFPDIVAAGLTQYTNKDKVWKKWHSLSEREREATALLNLGYSNGQIAVAMKITEAGVKFHLGKVYSKFRVKTRIELCKKFDGWDFSAWDKNSQEPDKVRDINYQIPD